MKNQKPGLLIYLQAKPGKQAALMEFLNKGLSVVAEEGGTQTWYAFQITGDRFGIYDTFRGDASREQHLQGKFAKALAGVEADLLAAPPEIRKVDILSSKPA
ncbi:quinol monooxygenase YgiN [Panacagrimonas perspica]|uniref:Quinol monooxygenase YgiN n=1 Tax=Panacagrimonas perspica TaxID=381431 RepID=A0A4R7NYR5_9GAMM|nr:antibiotic biosynthesis monooxygenase [Panacagrimonas perspica]TDU26485.1 quinol monooxygenase YgiN [Panacagrimonas perspica]THD02101.1 hypothetical protein B1810_16625 [Panacagrimonas perspica]